jgi:hypothetical protein
MTTPIGSSVVQLPELSIGSPATGSDTGGSIEDLVGGGSDPLPAPAPPAGGFAPDLCPATAC